jgi:hypothetical protein
VGSERKCLISLIVLSAIGHDLIRFDVVVANLDLQHTVDQSAVQCDDRDVIALDEMAIQTVAILSFVTNQPRREEVGAAATTQFVKSLLFGVGATDRVTFACGTAIQVNVEMERTIFYGSSADYYSLVG